ncbi:MAG: hypothetical protein WA021_04630 [Minisyncoccia bacterium]
MSTQLGSHVVTAVRETESYQASLLMGLARLKSDRHAVIKRQHDYLNNEARTLLPDLTDDTIDRLRKKVPRFFTAEVDRMIDAGIEGLPFLLGYLFPSYYSQEVRTRLVPHLANAIAERDAKNRVSIVARYNANLTSLDKDIADQEAELARVLQVLADLKTVRTDVLRGVPVEPAIAESLEASAQKLRARPVRNLPRKERRNDDDDDGLSWLEFYLITQYGNARGPQPPSQGAGEFLGGGASARSEQRPAETPRETAPAPAERQNFSTGALIGGAIAGAGERQSFQTGGDTAAHLAEVAHAGAIPTASPEPDERPQSVVTEAQTQPEQAAEAETPPEEETKSDARSGDSDDTKVEKTDVGDTNVQIDSGNTEVADTNTGGDTNVGGGDTSSGTGSE